jgi:hypothetical protein
MISLDEVIKNELMMFYEKQFGNKWMNNVHKQLVPSPYRFLSVVYNVPIDYVYNLHNQLMQQFKSSSGHTINASL